MTSLLLGSLVGPQGAQSRDVARCGLYEYRAVIRRVVDGDTVDADIRPGLSHVAA